MLSTNIQHFQPLSLKTGHHHQITLTGFLSGVLGEVPKLPNQRLYGWLAARDLTIPMGFREVEDVTLAPCSDPPYVRTADATCGLNSLSLLYGYWNKSPGFLCP